MWLEHDVHFAVSALARGCERGANLGGMMAVIINHAHSPGSSAQLETAVHAYETCKGGVDLRDWNVQTHSDGDCCGRIQDVVYAGDMKLEGPQSFPPVGHVEMTDALWLGFGLI